MRKFIIAITSVILLSSCKKTDNKSVSGKAEIKKDSAKVEDGAKTAQSNSNLLEQFSKNKNEVVLQLKSLPNREAANTLYEKYFEANGTLLQEIAAKESGVLDKFYNEDEADKKAVKLLGERLSKHELEYSEIGEGYVEIDPLHDFYYKIFKDYVTNDYKDYLYLKSEENKSLYSADAGLVISFKDLGDRIISWENFMVKYPNSKLIPSVKEQYKNYQMDYLVGQDNTPTVERSSDEKYIYPENIQEFNRFLKKYPKSPTVPLINLFLENFKSETIFDILSAEQSKL
jgi:TolA-binding protein